MESLFALIVLVSFILLVIGIFSPKKSLFWDKNNEPTKKRSLIIYGLSLITSFILFGIISDKSESNNNTSSSSKKIILSETKKVEKSPLTQQQIDSIAKIKKVEIYDHRKSQTVSARNLVASYIGNEVSADENFKGKKFYVSGKITDIKKDVFGNIYVTLKGSEMFREVQCYFDDTKTAAKLKKRMKVTFFGVCDGLMVNVQMKDCKLVKNLSELK